MRAGLVEVCHSEKESAAATWKRTFGYHPIFCFLDATGEALSVLLRPGNAGANTTADHIEVLDHALAQIPDAYRHGTPILIRSDSARSTRGFWNTSAACAGTASTPASRLGSPSPNRSAKPSAKHPAGSQPSTPTASRATARRSPRSPAWCPTAVTRPQPGSSCGGNADTSARNSISSTPVEGWRHQLFATDTEHGHGSIQFLEARHRAHARVEDRIRCGKDTGFGRFPCRVFAINTAWLEIALTGIDLIAWTQALLLDGDLARAEPKKLRYRLLHVAARIVRSGRRTWVRIASSWPWTRELAAAFARLQALPRPAP